MPTRSQVSLMAALGLSAVLLASPALAQKKPAAAAPTASSGTLMTINGKAIPKLWEAIFLGEQRSRGAEDSPELRAAIKDEIVRRVLIGDEARKKGIDKQPEVAAQMELAGQAVLIRNFIADYLQSAPVSDADVKKEYDRVNGLAGSVEYQVRHILVKTEDEAKAIIDKLKAGESFAKLAAQSIDTGSRDNGGELGWSVPASFVAPFGDEMKRLDKGKFSQTPVKSEFGYHVVQVDDKRNATPPALDDVRPGIERRLREEKLNAYVNELKQKARIQ